MGYYNGMSLNKLMEKVRLSNSIYIKRRFDYAINKSVGRVTVTDCIRNSCAVDVDKYYERRCILCKNSFNSIACDVCFNCLETRNLDNWQENDNDEYVMYLVEIAKKKGKKDE